MVNEINFEIDKQDQEDSSCINQLTLVICVGMIIESNIPVMVSWYMYT